MSDNKQPDHISASLQAAMDSVAKWTEESDKRWKDMIANLPPDYLPQPYPGSDINLQIANGILSTAASPILTGSADQLENRITKIEGMLTGMSASLSTQIKPDIQPFVIEVKGRLEEMSREVKEIRSSEVPAIKQANDLIIEVGPFIANALAARGRLEGQESKIDALTNRIATIEQNRERAWARSQWLITIVIGIVTAVGGWAVGYFIRTP